MKQHPVAVGREGVPRHPSRDAFVVRHRVRLGGLVSGSALVAAVAAAVLVVVTAPFWLVPMARDVHDVETAFVAVFAALLVVGLPCGIAVIAGVRPGNAALRRRVLAIDDAAIWIYRSAWWWSAPVRLPWAEVSGLRARTVEPAEVPSDQSGPGPIFVPWDHLVVEARTGGAGQAIGLMLLTASVEQIVDQARSRRPQLAFRDDRLPPAPGISGRVLRRRRRGSRWWLGARSFDPPVTGGWKLGA